MSTTEQQLAEDRITRDAARAVFNARWTRLRGALANRGVGQRVAEDALEQVKLGANTAVSVARVLGTALALLTWLARGPLLRWATKLVKRSKHGEPCSVRGRLRAWTSKRIRT